MNPPGLDDEITNRRRLVDQQATIYSVLRDRTARSATVLQLLVLAASFGLLVLSLVPDTFLLRFGFDPLRSRDAILVLSTAIFFLQVIELRLDLRGRAALFGDAAKRLYGLKAYFRRVRNRGPLRPIDRVNLLAEFDRIHEALPAIPDGQFPGLKAAHLRKVRLSRTISRFPNHPLWLLRLRFALRDIRRMRPLDD